METIEVQPSKAPEIIGCSVRTFYDNLEKENWEKIDKGSGKVAYRVPVEFAQRFRPKPQDTISPYEVMRETLEKVFGMQDELINLHVQVAQHKLLTAHADSEREQLLARIYQLEAENKTLKARRWFSWLPIG